MRIGELADAAGVRTRTIRFYERRGLLPEPRRAANGYRVYDEATLNRLRFIRTAQTAGLTLTEIRGITDIRDRGKAPCTHVDALLQSKRTEIRQQRKRLVALEADLNQLVERSRSLDPADCAHGDICHILQADTTPENRTSALRRVRRTGPVVIDTPQQGVPTC